MTQTLDSETKTKPTNVLKNAAFFALTVVVILIAFTILILSLSGDSPQGDVLAPAGAEMIAQYSLFSEIS